MPRRLISTGSPFEKAAGFSRAVIDGDRDAIARESVHVGYAAADDSPQRIEAAVDMCLLLCEPLRHVGRYDFGESNLPTRVRKLGFELAIRRRLLQQPPPETLFLHRKLVGSFMLLARLGAQVDARSLILPFLAKA